MSGRAMPCCFCQDGAYCLIDTGPVEAEDALLYDWTCWVCRRLTILC